eukprot:CAMPEP_0180535390 /NCGR_PEP_ID=MMETSP1036_2-20121128/64708_1 /TAXON_ID=632150 /ORGANISM="Azadinium spinosum, Strain 3D9" /LENGTH=120 /DNA_ID=CAMNT_0022549817 /DNA_START=87 /DNA_END=446 /DNA_ORIENTATION=+
MTSRPSAAAQCKADRPARSVSWMASPWLTLSSSWPMATLPDLEHARKGVEPPSSRRIGSACASIKAVAKLRVAASSAASPPRAASKVRGVRPRMSAASTRKPVRRRSSASSTLRKYPQCA